MIQSTLDHLVSLCVYCGLQSVKLHPFIQFEWPPWVFELSWHSCILHDHCIVLRFFIDYTELLLIFQHHYAIFMLNCLKYLLDCVLVPRLLWQINMVSDLTSGRSSFSQKHGFWQILHEKLSKISKFQHCTRSQGLPLNTPSKAIVDQDLALCLDHNCTITIWVLIGSLYILYLVVLKTHHIKIYIKL